MSRDVPSAPPRVTAAGEYAAKGLLRSAPQPASQGQPDSERANEEPASQRPVFFPFPPTARLKSECHRLKERDNIRPRPARVPEKEPRFHLKDRQKKGRAFSCPFKGADLRQEGLSLSCIPFFLSRLSRNELVKGKKPISPEYEEAPLQHKRGGVDRKKVPQGRRRRRRRRRQSRSRLRGARRRRRSAGGGSHYTFPLPFCAWCVCTGARGEGEARQRYRRRRRARPA